MIRFLVLLLLLVQCTTPEKTDSTPPPEKVESKVDRTEIRKTIASHKKYMSHCYGKALVSKNGAKLAGTVFVHFKIGPDGKALNPKMIPEKSTLQNESLNQCLFAGITSWDFPVHPDGLDLDIRYPFQFSELPPTGMQKTMDNFENLRNR